MEKNFLSYKKDGRFNSLSYFDQYKRVYRKVEDYYIDGKLYDIPIIALFDQGNLICAVPMIPFDSLESYFKDFFSNEYFQVLESFVDLTNPATRRIDSVEELVQYAYEYTLLANCFLTIHENLKFYSQGILDQADIEMFEGYDQDKLFDIAFDLEEKAMTLESLYGFFNHVLSKSPMINNSTMLINTLCDKLKEEYEMVDKKAIKDFIHGKSLNMRELTIFTPELKKISDYMDKNPGEEIFTEDDIDGLSKTYN